MLKNKKGFTLVEILAAVTILGILSAIAIVSVNKVIQQGKEKHYTTAEKNLMLAGQSYAQENRNELPKVIGQKKIISLRTLQNKNYIKEVLDYSDNTCDPDKSYVQIYKYSQNDYSYTPYLECPSYKTQQKVIQGNINIDITFTAQDVSPAKAHITITESNKLMSYSYIIYKNNKEVYNSGSVAVKDYATSVTKSVDLSDYTPGKIKIIVSATNILGHTQTVTESNDYSDKKGPTCIIADADKSSTVKAWTKGSRQITVGCSDEGTGCTRKNYTKTFSSTKTSIKTGTITIADEEGNTTNCPVSVYIDNKYPTIQVKAYKRTASGGMGELIKSVKTTSTYTARTLSLSSSWLNGEEYQYGIYYQVTVSDTEQLGSYLVKENAAGLKKTSSNVNTYTRNIVSANATSNSKTFTFTTTVDGYRKYEVTATDAVGNTAKVTITAPLDRTAPSQPTVNLYKWKNNSTRPTSATGLSSYTNNTWTNVNVYTTATGSTDALSDITYQYTTTGATANAIDEEQSYRSVEASGTSTIKYRACDAAGNCSAYTSAKTIKIDKVAPTCTSSGGNTTWTKNSVTLVGTCDDGEGSGCTQSTVTKVVNNEINSTNESPGTVYDKAGNPKICPGQTVKIDRTAPTCTNSGDSTTWTNSNRTITYGCSDDISQCDTSYDGGSQSFTTTTKTAPIASYTIKDNAGNSRTCPARTANVYVDKTAPSCTTTTTNSSWTNTDVTLTGTCSDSDSGCVSRTITKTFTEEMNSYQTPGMVKDNAGNETNCDKYQVRIDKTKPYIVSASLVNMYIEQWSGDTYFNPYVKSYNCNTTTCNATVCVENKPGSMYIYGEDLTFADALSGYYSYDESTQMYTKNGTKTTGCRQTRGENPCTWKWTYTFYDRAGNYDTFTIDYKIGYQGLNDGIGC